MIKIVEKQFTQEEWRDIVSGFEDLSLTQTWEYGAAKARTGSGKVSRALFFEGSEVVGAVQAAVRTVPGLRTGGLVWINRGPLWRRSGREEDILRLRLMFLELRRYWVEERKMYLYLTPPLLQDRNSLEVVEEAGFSFRHSAPGWASELVSLTGSTEDIRKGLRQKWRNCLNKSERSGLTCETGDSAELLEEVFSDYKELVSNKCFTTNLSLEFTAAMQEFLPEESKMWVFSARQGEKKLGSVLVAGYGNTCMYYIGAVNNEGRRTNANYFLLWQALCKMKDRGYEWFDVGGANPEVTPPGILHFKQGLGGTQYKLVGEFEAFENSVLARLIRWRVGRRG